MSTNSFFFHSRLSYHQRLVDTCPESFSNLLPIKPAAFYKYDREGAGIHAYKSICVKNKKINMKCMNLSGVL